MHVFKNKSFIERRLREYDTAIKIDPPYLHFIPEFAPVKLNSEWNRSLLKIKLDATADNLTLDKQHRALECLLRLVQLICQFVRGHWRVLFR